jgi:hypothetical protein
MNPSTLRAAVIEMLFLRNFDFVFIDWPGEMSLYNNQISYRPACLFLIELQLHVVKEPSTTPLNDVSRKCFELVALKCFCAAWPG